MPEKFAGMTVLDAVADREKISSAVDFCFCAVNMKKDDLKELEYSYAKAECPIVSNNSAHRATADVPMIIPEINAEHLEVIEAQKKRLGTKRGFIAVKSNCSLQSYVPLLHPLKKFGINEVAVCTYQAISGAGKRLKLCPKLWITLSPTSAAKKKKAKTSPSKSGAKSKAAKSSPQLRPKSPLSV